MPVMSTYRAAAFTPEVLPPGLSCHVFLIAIRGEPQSPVLHRGKRLHPMQVILTGSGELPLAELEAAIGPLPALPPPHRLMRNSNPSASLTPREITGVISARRQWQVVRKGRRLRTPSQSVVHGVTWRNDRAGADPRRYPRYPGFKRLKFMASGVQPAHRARRPQQTRQIATRARNRTTRLLRPASAASVPLANLRGGSRQSRDFGGSFATPTSSTSSRLSSSSRAGYNRAINLPAICKSTSWP